MGNGPIQLDFGFGTPHGARGADDEDPFRILVLADLGVSAPARAMLPLAQRKPLSVDIDNFDAVLARLAPRLEVALDDTELAIDFGSLDDFHPDRLYARLPPFAALRALRVELGDPAHFRRAAAVLGATPAGPPASTSAAAADANDIERLLGRKPAAPSPASAIRPGVDIEGGLRRIVAPHVVPVSRKFKPPFSPRGTVLPGRQAVNRAVFGNNFPLSMTIRSLNRPERPHVDAMCPLRASAGRAGSSAMLCSAALVLKLAAGKPASGRAGGRGGLSQASPGA